MNWKQFLTENVLHECWHERVQVGDILNMRSECSCGKPDYLGTANGHINRPFDNRNDLLDLYEAIYKKGKWKEFIEYAFKYYKEDYSEEHFYVWLFCLRDKEHEVLYRCFLVSAWLEVKNSQSTVVSPIIVNGMSVSLEVTNVKNNGRRVNP